MLEQDCLIEMLKSPILCKSFPQKLSFTFAEGLNSHFKGFDCIYSRNLAYIFQLFVLELPKSAYFNYVKFSFNFC